MKKRKHKYGYYKRPCAIQIKQIPGLSNNNLRMHKLGALRSNTVKKWYFKYWNIEMNAKLANWCNKLDAYGINKRGENNG